MNVLSDTEKPNIIFSLLTGVSSVSISCATIYSDLNIPMKCRSRNLPKMMNRKRFEFRKLFNQV